MYYYWITFRMLFIVLATVVLANDYWIPGENPPSSKFKCTHVYTVVYTCTQLCT